MKRNILLPLFAIICGILLPYFFNTTIKSPYILLVCILFLSLIFLKRIHKLTVILSIIVFLITIANFNARMNYTPINIKDDTKITAKITSAIIYKDNKVTFYAKNLSNDNKKILVNIYSDNPNEISDLRTGDIYAFHGDMKLPKKKSNYGSFDYNLYLKTMNVYSYFNVNSYKLKEHGNLFLHIDKLFDFREHVKEIIYDKIYDNSASSLLMGIFFSDKGVDNEVKENFTDSGLAHILAVSGMHIGLIYAFLMFFLSFFDVKSSLRNIIAVPFLAIYIILSGLTPSAIRAGLFCIIANFASSQKYKDSDSLSITLFIASILLLINPLLIFNLSFQLSFMSVVGIILLNPVLNFFVYDKNLREKAPILSYIFSYSFVCIACQLFTLPIVVNSFTKVPIISIISNLAVVWAVAPIMILAFFGILLNKLIFAPIFFILIKILLQFMIIITSFIGNLSFGKIQVYHLNFFQVLLYYIVIFILFKYIPFKRIATIFTIFILIFAIYLSYKPTNSLQVHFLDLAQADGICVLTKENKCIFFDGGNSYGRDNSSYVIEPFLNYFHIKNIDIAFITHTDSDHYQALSSSNVEINKAYIPKTDNKDVLSLSDNINIAKKGKVVTIDKDTKVTILTEVKNISKENNENNIIYLLEYKNKRILITGDMAYSQEKKILNDHIDCDILKAAHHGSFDELSSKFLKKTSPDFVIIQSGNNPYNLPNEEYINLLENNNLTYFNTKNNGAVHFELNEKINLRKVFIE